MINIEKFKKADLRVGTIIEAIPFTEAKNNACKLKIDFGGFGIKQTSAQILKLYTTQDLVGKQIIAVVNLPVKKVVNFFSEVLVLGVGNDSDIVLLGLDLPMPNGTRIS